MTRRVTTAEQRKEIAARYLERVPVAAIAAEYGIAPKTVYAVLASEGVDTSLKEPFTPEQAKEMAAKYAQLWTIRELSHAYGHSYGAVRRALLGEGVVLRKRGWWGQR